MAPPSLETIAEGLAKLDHGTMLRWNASRVAADWLKMRELLLRHQTLSEFDMWQRDAWADEVRHLLAAQESR